MRGQKKLSWYFLEGVWNAMWEYVFSSGSVLHRCMSFPAVAVCFRCQSASLPVPLNALWHFVLLLLSLLCPKQMEKCFYACQHVENIITCCIISHNSRYCRCVCVRKRRPPRLHSSHSAAPDSASDHYTKVTHLYFLVNWDISQCRWLILHVANHLFHAWKGRWQDLRG